MDYAERGELLKLCEEEGKFAFTQEHSQDFLSEIYLKKIFLDIIEGLSYRIFNFLTRLSLIFNKQQKKNIPFKN